MSLTINSNIAATRASKYLASNHQNLQKSLDRLSSGKRISEPADDAGGLAVSMKLENEINQLEGAANNLANAISFLQVQDGVFETIGNIVMRMGELYSMSQDVLQDGSTIYDSEVVDLAAQLAAYATADNTTFNDVDVMIGTALTIQAGGQSIDISRSATGAALVTQLTSTANFTTVTTAAGIGLTNGVTNVNTVLDNIAALRAANGGEANRLMYAQENVATQITNLTAANGRIVDVDIAAESANLAKQQILVQASASMVAQANSANNVALTLLQ